MDKSLRPGALPRISRDMVVSKTDERITPKELEMGEQSRNEWLFGLSSHQILNLGAHIYVYFAQGTMRVHIKNSEPKGKQMSTTLIRLKC